MMRLLLLISIACTGTPSLSDSEPISDKRLILIIGQSNARGAGHVVDLTDQTYASSFAAVRYMSKLGGNTNPPIFVAYNWHDLEPEIFSGSETLGIELSLGRDLVSSGTWSIAKYTMDSTSLASNWLPSVSYPISGFRPFDDMIAYAKSSEVTANSRLAAVIWIQGENDAGGMGTSDAYGYNLMTFVMELRARLGPVPFIYGRLNIDCFYAYTSIVRDRQTAFASTMPDLIMIDQDSFPLDTKRLHYGADALVALGHAYAKVIP